MNKAWEEDLSRRRRLFWASIRRDELAASVGRLKDQLDREVELLEEAQRRVDELRRIWQRGET
jgi:flagellar biosynthesis regulator FlaF